MKQSIRYSVIVPMFNEEAVIQETYKRLTEIMMQTREEYEIIFVNDGSRDRTSEIVTMLCEQDAHIRMLNFSRNFGHQIAITAGMDYAAGQAIVVIDADLQDPPEVILQMIAKWKEGFDVVYGRRSERKGETWFKKLTARMFYRLLRYMTNVEIPVDTGDFRLIDRKVLEVMRKFTEKNRYVRGLVSWIGFKQTEVLYVREERFAGETKYPLRKMIRFAMDAITSFSYKPLKLATYLGFIMSMISFVYLIYALYTKLFTTRAEPGWTSTVAINLFFNGIMFIILGVIGEYVGRIYDESKNRPLYIIRDEIGYEQLPGQSRSEQNE